ncbi:MAG: GNAT family N-acetyltransferase [Clostridia bacterium]|nr:GNAT family N-acetyltransferase [Clostridia bacterium]
MTILHPQQPVNNMNPEDVFFAVDDLGTQVGSAWILYQLQPGLYPDCPVNLYFSLEGDASSRYLLFGAVVARARVLLSVNPQAKARLYTSLNPQDLQSQDFFRNNGFDLSESDSLVSLQIPFGDGRIPMSCTVAATPLNTWEEQQTLLTRLQLNEITYLDRNALMEMMHMPHFLALGLYRNSMLIGETLLCGAGDQADVAAIYIEPSSRRQGMGRALLHRSLAILAAEGVTRVTARIMTRSLPQQHLAAEFGAVPLGVNMIFPSMYLN